MRRFLLNSEFFNILLPVTVVLLVLFGWYLVYTQTQTTEQTNIAAYQQTELELVRSMGRSIEVYIEQQMDILNRDNISEIEQEVLKQFIAPVHLLENGDAWIYTPEYVVFDKSSDFPDEYRDKNMAQIFATQVKSGASHYEEMTEAVMNTEEGVGWYIWLPEKGEEIAAWTPVTVNGYSWIIGISTPLAEIMEATGANAQINTLMIAMSLTSLIVIGLMAVWAITSINRRRVERALRQSEKKRRLHIEQTPIAVIECNAQGQISSWNRAAEMIFGYTAQESRGKVAADLLIADGESETPLDLSDNFYGHGQEAVLSTIKNQTKDGEVIICDWYNTLLQNETSQTIGITLMAADVTERIQREREIRIAKEQAEKATRAKSDFLSSMSHELRTPLNGIMGYAQILKRDKTLSRSHKNDLNIIYKSGHHLLTLINDILDLSKIEARKMDLYPTDFELQEFLTGIVALIQMKAEEKGILFKYRTESKSPVGVLADEKRLRQILINLLSNAVKFTDYGQVSLRVTVLESKLNNMQLPTKKIRFEINDTGVGMSAEQLKSIFLPFEQVGDTKRRAEGTGLGLAITRQLVGLMGGEVKVKSELGKGSTFWFDLILPVMQAELKELEARSSQQIIAYQGKRRKILVIDDRLENRLVLKHMLKPLGFQIETGENGSECLAKAKSFKPDLILTDLVMPVMSGFEAVKILRQTPDLKDIPIVAISASVFEMDRKQSQIVGCDGFLPKPVEEDKLLEEIEEHLGVEWIYEEIAEEAITVRNEEVESVVPPQEELEQLYELAMLGNIYRIQERAKHLLELDKKYAQFANKLHKLARNFEDEQILTLIQKHLVLLQA